MYSPIGDNQELSCIKEYGYVVRGKKTRIKNTMIEKTALIGKNNSY